MECFFNILFVKRCLEFFRFQHKNLTSLKTRFLDVSQGVSGKTILNPFFSKIDFYYIFRPIFPNFAKTFLKQCLLRRFRALRSREFGTAPPLLNKFWRNQPPSPSVSIFLFRSQLRWEQLQILKIPGERLRRVVAPSPPKISLWCLISDLGFPMLRFRPETGNHAPWGNFEEIGPLWAQK